MYDYGLSVLSHYGLTASGTMRVRGALLCHTEQGDKLISEFGTAAEKLEQRYLLQCRITESGLLRCDQILRNEEGALATRGDDGGTYIVRNWYPGRECETGNSEDLIRASDALARLHTAAHLPVKMEYRRESLVEECIRHNVEIRKIRKYLQTKKKKNVIAEDMKKCHQEWKECIKLKIIKNRKADFSPLFYVLINNHIRCYIHRHNSSKV